MSEASSEFPTDKEIFQQADKDALKHKAEAAKDAVADLAGEAKHYAAARAADAMETTKSKVADIGGQAVDYIQRNPYQALAIAAGIGFVAGLILKRR